MDYISTAGIALGLSMDALAVCITNGAVTRKVRLPFALKLACCFALFQAGMPMIGWLVGKAGEAFIAAVDHWVALILLGWIGTQMILESRKKSGREADGRKQNDIGFRRLCILAVATSIDALVTGIILPTAVRASTPERMFIAAGIIGSITFLVCFAGVWAGKKFGELCSSSAETAGGAVLIGIGIKIFTEHLFFD